MFCFILKYDFKKTIIKKEKKDKLDNKSDINNDILSKNEPISKLFCQFKLIKIEFEKKKRYF